MKKSILKTIMSFSLSLVVMGSTITYAEKACDDTMVNNGI